MAPNTKEAVLCEIIARIVVKSILVAIQIVQNSRECLGSDEQGYKDRLNKQIASLDDVHKYLKNPMIGKEIQPRDRHTYFHVMKGLHALLLEYVKVKGPQTEEAKRFYKNMSAVELIKELEESDTALTEPEDAQQSYWLRLSEKFSWTVLRKKGAEKLILEVELRGQALDKLLSETIPPILSQLPVSQIQKAMASENLPKTRVKQEILCEKKREDDAVIGSMEGLSLGSSSTELKFSQIRLNHRPSGIKEVKDGDENDQERTDLGGSSRRQWAELLDLKGNVIHERVIVEFKERPVTAIRDEKRANEVRLQLRSLVRELRLASKTAEAKPFQVLYCLGFYETDGGYGIVYRPPPSETYNICESLGNVLLKEEYKRLLRKDPANRLDLARALAFTMYSLHSVQWVHKSFNPDNILLFGTADANNQVKFDWTSPYVVGFDASRTNIAHSDKIPTSIRWENRVYAHPHRQRNGDSEIKRFSKEYDIYSLGVVLLEIGQMKCFKHSDYRKSKAWTDIPAIDVQKKLLSLAQEDLTEFLGQTYSKAVVTCLEGKLSEVENDNTGTGLLAAFRSEICERFDYVRT